MEQASKATAGEDRLADAKRRAANQSRGPGSKSNTTRPRTGSIEFKSWLQSQFQSPIPQHIITLWGGLGSWALLNVVANKIIAGQVAGVRRSERLCCLWPRGRRGARQQPRAPRATWQGW